MSTITLPYSISNGDALDVDQVMANENAIVTEYNASVAAQSGDLLSTTNTKTVTNKTLTAPIINSPKINEAVALTATSTELNLLSGKTALTVSRAFTWYLDGTSIVANGVGAKYISPQALTTVRISAITTSGTATIRLNRGATVIQDAISVTNTIGHTTSFASGAISAYDLITLDITAASSCVGLTVCLETTQP